MDAKEAAQLLGRLGGLSRSEKKREASRANGRSGGRPPVANQPETEQPAVHVFTTQEED
jgi:hypothetical protein